MGGVSWGHRRLTRKKAPFKAGELSSSLFPTNNKLRHASKAQNAATSVKCVSTDRFSEVIFETEMQ